MATPVDAGGVTVGSTAVRKSQTCRAESARPRIKSPHSGDLVVNVTVNARVFLIELVGHVMQDAFEGSECVVLVDFLKIVFIKPQFELLVAKVRETDLRREHRIIQFARVVVGVQALFVWWITKKPARIVQIMLERVLTACLFLVFV